MTRPRADRGPRFPRGADLTRLRPRRTTCRRAGPRPRRALARSRGEKPLVDRMPRTVLEDPLLPFLGLDALVLGRVDDDQLRAHPASLFQKRRPLVLEEVTVEVRGDQLIEFRVGGTVEAPHPPPERARSAPSPRRGDHLGALVECDDLARRSSGFRKPVPQATSRVCAGDNPLEGLDQLRHLG